MANFDFVSSSSLWSPSCSNGLLCNSNGTTAKGWSSIWVSRVRLHRPLAFDPKTLFDFGYSGLHGWTVFHRQRLPRGLEVRFDGPLLAPGQNFQLFLFESSIYIKVLNDYKTEHWFELLTSILKNALKYVFESFWSQRRFSSSLKGALISYRTSPTIACCASNWSERVCFDSTSFFPRSRWLCTQNLRKTWFCQTRKSQPSSRIWSKWSR